MAEKRKNKKGFTFENSINLSEWSFNRIEAKQDEAFTAFEDSLEKFLEKQTEKLRKSLGKIDDRVKGVAAEALLIAFEGQVISFFNDVKQAPWQMEVYLPDFAEDGYAISLDIREPVREMLKERCSPKDGYVSEKYKEDILNFAKMLGELKEELVTAIRPENNDA